MMIEPKWKEAFPPAKKSKESMDRSGWSQEPPRRLEYDAIGDEFHEINERKMATDAGLVPGQENPSNKF